MNNVDYVKIWSIWPYLQKMVGQARMYTKMVCLSILVVFLNIICDHGRLT